MKFYTRKRRQPMINIVSLIDILAILLIFFIVTTTFRTRQAQIKIDLPESQTAEKATVTSDEPILLQVKGEKEILLDGKSISLDTLAAALKSLRATSPERPIAMQADRQAPFGVIVQIYDACRLAGVRNISAFTESTSGKTIDN